MGFLPVCRGRTHLPWTSGAMISSTTACPQGFLVVEVVIQRPLGDPSYGQNGVQAGTLETRSVDLAGRRLQQALPGALRIAQPSRSTFRIFTYRQHTDQYVC